jgi:hypothetical protein
MFGIDAHALRRSTACAADLHRRQRGRTQLACAAVATANDDSSTAPRAGSSIAPSASEAQPGAAPQGLQYLGGGHRHNRIHDAITDGRQRRGQS